MGVAQVFVWPDTILYAAYAGSSLHAAMAPLTDQRLGGIAMLVEGTLVTSSAFAWLFLRWLAESEAAARGVGRTGLPAGPPHACRRESPGPTGRA